MAKFNECSSEAVKFFRNSTHNFIESLLKHADVAFRSNHYNSAPQRFLSHKISTEYLITTIYNMQDDILQCKFIP